MKMRRCGWSRACAFTGIALAAGLCAAWSQVPVPGTAGTPDIRPPSPASAPVAKTYKTRVFRIATCDADDVRQILESLLEEPPDVTGGMPGGGLGGGGPLGGGVLPGVPGGAGPFAPGTPGGLGFGGGIGGLGGGGFGGLGGIQHGWRVSVHSKTRSLVVRGTERDLQIAADLVAVLETPEDKPLPATKHLRAFRLKHADADELVQVTEDLGLEARVVAASLAKLLIAAGADEALSDLASVIKELDVDPNSKEKPPEPRKLRKNPDMN